MPMRIDIITLFPEMFAGPFDKSIVKRAQDAGKVEIKIHDLRNWGLGERRTVDDTTYGGGVGMVLMVEPVDNAITQVKSENKGAKVVLLTPQGKVYSQSLAQSFSEETGLILIAGHYEGYDERIRSLVDDQVSIGDYVLTGGEIPAMAIVDSVVRLIPTVLKESMATVEESFSGNLLEYPQYTKPADYKGMRVPDILLSGDHPKIAEWRNAESVKKTKAVRPDIT